jgi:hypothetical protein
MGHSIEIAAPAGSPASLPSRSSPDPPQRIREAARHRVVGDADGHASNSRCSSPTVGEAGRSGTRRIASSTPGMKLVRSVVE